MGKMKDVATDREETERLEPSCLVYAPDSEYAYVTVPYRIVVELCFDELVRAVENGRLVAVNDSVFRTISTMVRYA